MHELSIQLYLPVITLLPIVLLVQVCEPQAPSLLLCAVSDPGHNLPPPSAFVFDAAMHTPLVASESIRCVVPPFKIQFDVQTPDSLQKQAGANATPCDLLLLTLRQLLAAAARRRC